MKRIFILGIIGLLGAVLLVSCYRDKGDYDYRDLNEISIELPDVVYVQQGEVLEVVPTLNFSAGKEEENLSFEWVVSIPEGASDTSDVVLSTERIFSERIDYASGNSYPFNFKITDNNTNVTYRKELILEVRSHLAPGFFVVERYANHGDVSFYNTELDSTFYNVFSNVNTDVMLPANITDMYSIDYNGYSVQVSDDESFNVAAGNISMIFGEDWGYVVDFRSLRVLSTVDEMFLTKPDVIRPQVLASVTSPNFLLMNDGKVHRMSQNKGQTLFGDAFVPYDGNSDYDCAPFIGLGFRGQMGVLFFDELEHRFFSMATQADYLNFTSDSTAYVVEQDTILYAAEIEESWELLAMPQGGMMNTSYFMVFEDVAEDGLYVATYSLTNKGFRGGGLEKVDEQYCPGMRESSVYVAPYGRSQLYYANGNEIRLYDVEANRSEVIYTFSGGENITAITFLPNSGSQMAVATYDGSKGAVYMFELENTGLLKSSTPTAYASDFGEIIKLVYKK